MVQFYAVCVLFLFVAAAPFIAMCIPQKQSVSIESIEIFKKKA